MESHLIFCTLVKIERDQQSENALTPSLHLSIPLYLFIYLSIYPFLSSQRQSTLITLTFTHSSSVSQGSHERTTGDANSPDVSSKFVSFETVEVGPMPGLGLSEPIRIDVLRTVPGRVFSIEGSLFPESPGTEQFAHRVVVVLKLPPGYKFREVCHTIQKSGFSWFGGIYQMVICFVGEFIRNHKDNWRASYYAS